MFLPGGLATFLIMDNSYTPTPRFVRIPEDIVAEFTVYKDRALSWIKLERKWLDDYVFTQLPLSQRGVIFHLWLLAARMGNKLPADPEWLGYTLRADPGDFDIERFVAAGYFEYVDSDSGDDDSTQVDEVDPASRLPEDQAPREIDRPEEKPRQRSTRVRRLTDPTKGAKATEGIAS